MGGGGRKTQSGLILAMMRLWTIIFPFFWASVYSDFTKGPKP